MALLNRYVDATLGTDTAGNGSSSGSSAWATLSYAISQISAYSAGDTVALYCANAADSNDGILTWPSLSIDALQIIGDIPQDGSYTGFDSSYYYCQDVQYISQTTFCPITFERIQLRTNKASGVSYALTNQASGGNDIDFDQSYIGVVGASTNQAYGFRMRDDTASHNIYRTIFEGGQQTGSVGVYMQSDGLHDMLNNTICGWENATFISMAAGTRPFENNVGYDNTSGDFYNASTSILQPSNNCSEDGYANDTNHVTTTQSGTQLFTDEANGDFTIPNTSSDLYSNGADESAVFTTDITGNTFSTNDIGAFAYVAGNPTLTAGSGSYSLSGNSAGILAERNLSANSGSFSLSGNSVSLNAILNCVAGNYSYSGLTVNLLGEKLISANSGSYIKTGFDIGLIKGFVLSGVAGSYSYSGFDSALLKNLNLSCVAGDYNYSGNNINLLESYLIYANSGNYSYSGFNATLQISGALIANSGSYLLDGFTSNLIGGFVLNSEIGTYSLIGDNVNLTLGGASLSVDSGIYLQTGNDTNLIADRLLAANPGLYNLNGQNSNLLKGFNLNSEVGTYLIAGLNINLISDRYITGLSGNYLYSGFSVALSYSGAVSFPDVEYDESSFVSNTPIFSFASSTPINSFEN